MPNGFNPKDLLKQQATIPKSVLAAMGPLAQLGEGLSGVLSQIAAQVPDAPPIPMMENGGPALAGMGPLADMMKGIQAALPAGLPKFPGGNSNPATKTAPAGPAARPASADGAVAQRGSMVEEAPTGLVATRGSL